MTHILSHYLVEFVSPKLLVIFKIKNLIAQNYYFKTIFFILLLIAFFDMIFV